METDTPRPRRARTIIRRLLLSAVLLVILPSGAILILHLEANRQAAPPELMNPPRELLQPEAPQPVLAPTPKPQKFVPQILASSLEHDPSQQNVRDLIELFRQLDYQRTPTAITATWTNLTKWKKEYPRVWYPGEPLRPGMAEWLSAHHDFVETCLRFGEHAKLANPEAGEIPYEPQSMDVLTGYISILSAEMQACQASGDTARARRIGTAMTTSFQDMLSQPLTRPLLTRWRYELLSRVTGLVRADMLTSDSLKRLEPVLVDLFQDAFDPAYTKEWIRYDGLCFRGEVVTKMNAPWYSAHYSREQWDSSKNWLYLENRYVPDIYVEIPRPGLVVKGIKTMYEASVYKRQSPTTLSRFDQIWPATVEYAGLSYPELMRKPPLILPWHDGILFYDQGGGGNITNNDYSIIIKIRARQRRWYETWIGLTRAAIAWRIDPGSAPRDSNMDMSRDLRNPWRDPYTERPLRIEQTTTATLIYSLGPDLIDQHGLDLGHTRPYRIENNKLIFTPGDYVIWLRR